VLDERVLRKARAQAIASGIIVSRRFKFTRRPQERESPSEDLIQCSRPFDQFLVTVRLRGRDIVAILEANVDPQKDVHSNIDTAGWASRSTLGRATRMICAARRAGPNIRARPNLTI
jgi:hypothetical protein